MNQEKHLSASIEQASVETISMVSMVEPEHYDNASPLIKHQISHEQTYGLFAVLRNTVYYTLIFSTLSVYVLWRAVPHAELLSWYCVIASVGIGRHLVCLQFEKAQPSGKRLHKWLHVVWVASVLVGVTWCGLVWVTWSSSNVVIIAFVATMLAFLALGSYAAMGFYPEAYLGSAIPQCLGIAILFIHVAGGHELSGLLIVILMMTFSMILASTASTRIWRSTMVFLHEHQNLARSFREKSAVLSTTLHSIGDGVLTVDRNGLVTYINPAAETVTGLSLQDVVGKAVAESLVLTDEAADGRPVDLAAVFKDVREALILPGELVLHSLCVTAVSVDVTISPLLYLPGAQVDGYVVTLHDVTSSRSMARDLSHQALHDPLTGLLNRRGFETRLHQALEQKLHDSVSHCLCYIDLDRFKAVNDSCGHQGGDELLKQIVTLIQSRVRDADSFARLGGDEFAILLRGCPLDRARKVAESICEEVANYRFLWDEKDYSIGASIGVVPMVQNDSLKNISEAADNACYQAKETGRGRVCIDSRITVE